MFVFWFLILIFAVVVVLVLTHLWGEDVYDTTEKIYKSLMEEEDNERW